MFAANHYLNQQIYLQTETTEALSHYRLARARARRNQKWAALTGRSNHLLELFEVASAGRRYFAGTQFVPVEQIRGTEGRSKDFDRDFNPIRDHTRGRWLGLFTAWQNGVTLPPVELVRVDDTYFVRDGHHRVSVARALGQDYIEAVVTVWE
jgi:hypothetical protein